MRNNFIILWMLLRSTLFLTLANACLASKKVMPTSDPLGRISVRGQWLVDEHGRIRIFHGANSVIKVFPWYDPQTLNETRLNLFKSWGFNVMRLGTMWSGMQPEKGKYNQTYIDIIANIVKKYEEHGIYALLDVHQDVLSSHYGTYDGIPAWLFDELPKQKLAFPWPFSKNATIEWWEGYITKACGYAYQSFYDNKAGSISCFMDLWEKVASTFKKTTSVIGYELINEPWAGDVWGDPLILLPGNAGRINLKPMYDKLNSAIRKVDRDTLVFFEPTTFGVVFNGTDMGTGFDSPPGGVEYANSSVLAWHYYCWIVTGAHEDPFSQWKRDLCDTILGPKVFETIKGDSKRLKVPTFLTEFGLCVPDNSTTSKETIECGFIMQKADEYMVSWTYWDSQFFNSEGHVNNGSANAFSRVYARAISGTPTFMNYNVTTREFQFRYNVNRTISKPTEIFIPLRHYPKGFMVSVSIGLEWHWDKDSSCILVTPSTKLYFRKQMAVKGAVHITPK